MELVWLTGHSQQLFTAALDWHRTHSISKGCSSSSCDLTTPRAGNWHHFLATTTSSRSPRTRGPTAATSQGAASGSARQPAALPCKHLSHGFPSSCIPMDISCVSCFLLQRHSHLRCNSLRSHASEVPVHSKQEQPPSSTQPGIHPTKHSNRQADSEPGDKPAKHPSQRPASYALTSPHTTPCASSMAWHQSRLRQP